MTNTISPVKWSLNFLPETQKKKTSNSVSLQRLSSHLAIHFENLIFNSDHSLGLQLTSKTHFQTQLQIQKITTKTQISKTIAKWELIRAKQILSKITIQH